MKKAIFLCLILSIILIGCSNNSNTTNKSVTTERNQDIKSNSTNSNNGIPSYYQDYIVSPQVIDDRTILEIGQSFKDHKGEGILKAINNETNTFLIGQIELTIREVKILQFKPDYSLIDFYHSYTQAQEFDFIKLFVEIKNTSNKPLKFAPAAIINTNSGEKKTWEDDIYLEELNGQIEANAKKKGNIGFILEESDIDSIEITTSDVFNQTDKKITDAGKIQIEF